MKNQTDTGCGRPKCGGVCFSVDTNIDRGLGLSRYKCDTCGNEYVFKEGHLYGILNAAGFRRVWQNDAQRSTEETP